MKEIVTENYSRMWSLMSLLCLYASHFQVVYIADKTENSTTKRIIRSLEHNCLLTQKREYVQKRHGRLKSPIKKRYRSHLLYEMQEYDTSNLIGF